jgi:hypothetical protein
MTTNQYLSFCLEHLQKPETYLRINNVSIYQLRQQVSLFYDYLIATDPLSARSARIIVHNLENTKLAYFHGVPKIHKSPMGCRPIVSHVNSPTTGLSKWITHLLAPIAATIRSFVRDSSTFQADLLRTDFSATDEMYTLDVVDMYTSIPIEEALRAVAWFLFRVGHPIMHEILKALRIVLETNFFTFGDTTWRQLRGLAMGTPVAPVVATLYLGYYEETRLLPPFTPNIMLYRRYIDDILLIWRPQAEKPYALNHFRALLRSVPGLSWTSDAHPVEANFLDLWIYRDESEYGTRTHQKKLNLYLYPTFNSAHPISVKHGMIYGLLKKYSEQNTRRSDFLAIATLLFKRFLARGYHFKILRDIFTKCLERLRENSKPAAFVAANSGNASRNFFFKIPYDPNGPPRQFLRHALRFDELSSTLADHGLGSIRICYSKPDNLGNIIMRTRTTMPIPPDLGSNDL